MTPRKTNVRLEDLLRLKRAERPPPEFWNKFEREMRAKELAAIVEPRPWWAPLIRVGSRVSRHQLPIGAAAILALSFVTVREYRTTEVNPTFRAELAARTGERSETAPVARAMTVPLTAAGVAQPALRREDATRVASTPEAALRAATGQYSHAAPLKTTAPVIQELTPSARYIAANLAVLQAADPRLIEDAFGPVGHRVEVSEPVRDPLAQITTPGDSRRSRLLTSALPAIATTVSIGSSDRLVRRLSEERLYDSVSRVGVSGDRVAIRF